MKINGTPFRTIWPTPDGAAVEIIDQTRLPHAFTTVRLSSLADATHAIAAMLVRGAPLIGVTAAYGLMLAARSDPSTTALEAASARLLATRPTAVNLKWALGRMMEHLLPHPEQDRAAAAHVYAGLLAEEDVATNAALGEHGATLLAELWRQKASSSAKRLNILTHCNAGWLATVDWGTALAPLYKAHDAGIPLHVWVDETRPRNQGASLTACELNWHGIAHTVIADNAGGHLMQHGQVDVCLVGADRVTRRGDVCNKIGTYLKALAAEDNGVPFWVAVPSSTMDWTMADGVAEIPIEERSPDEQTYMTGLSDTGEILRIRVTPEGTAAGNWGFDVTPARLVSLYLTERGASPTPTSS